MVWIRSQMARVVGALAASLALAFVFLSSKKDAKKYGMAAKVVGVLGAVLAVASYALSTGAVADGGAEKAYEAAIRDFLLSQGTSEYRPALVQSRGRAELYRLLGLGYAQADAVEGAMAVFTANYPWGES